MNPKDWQQATGAQVSISTKSVWEYLAALPDSADLDDDELMPWHPEEELVMKPIDSFPSMVLCEAKSMGRSLMLVAAVVSLGIGVVRINKDSLFGGRSKQSESHYV